MSQASEFLLSPQPRARWMRFDTAQILKRFFFCERSLLLSQAAWIPVVAPLEIKTGLARFVWQNAETADALRERVFELRFPSRLLEEEGADHALIELFSGITDSRSVLGTSGRGSAFERWRCGIGTARIGGFRPAFAGVKAICHSSSASARPAF